MRGAFLTTNRETSQSFMGFTSTNTFSPNITTHNLSKIVFEKNLIPIPLDKRP